MFKRFKIRRNSGKDFIYFDEMYNQLISLNQYLEKQNSYLVEQNKALTSQLVEKANMCRDLEASHEALKEEFEKAKLSYQKGAHNMLYDRKMLQKSNRNQSRLLREKSNRIEELKNENNQLRNQLIRLHWSNYNTD